MRNERVLEHAEILYDTVVDEGQSAALGEMGMGIGVVRLPVGGPAGMADADGAGGVFPLQEMLQVVHLPLALVQFYLAVFSDEGDACTVIAPVLEPVQSLDDHGARLAFPDITNDSTHNLLGFV